MAFQIIYEDEDLVVINKPSGIMVHKTSITEDKVFILQLLRNQVGKRLYPVHRLDRGTSGVLLFATSGKVAGLIQKQFREKQVLKKYTAIVRGFLPEQGTIDSPLKNGDGSFSEARTDYIPLKKTEKPYSISRYPTSRYSLLEIYPLSGKFHQIRRHLAHIRHPVIGDKKHGDCKHNKYFTQEFGLSRMLLHANMLHIIHPVTEEKMVLMADYDPDFNRFLQLLELG